MDLNIAAVEVAYALGRETAPWIEDLDFDLVVIVAFLALRLACVLEKAGAGKPVHVIQPARTVERERVNLKPLLAAWLLGAGRAHIEALSGLDIVRMELKTIKRARVEVDLQGSIRRRPDVTAKGALLGTGCDAAITESAQCYPAGTVDLFVDHGRPDNSNVG